MGGYKVLYSSKIVNEQAPYSYSQRKSVCEMMFRLRSTSKGTQQSKDGCPQHSPDDAISRLVDEIIFQKRPLA